MATRRSKKEASASSFIKKSSTRKNQIQSIDEFRGKHFNLHHLNSFQAKTESQKDFLYSYFQTRQDIIVQIGSPGTGKTIMSMYAALTDVLDNQTYYEKIIIIRSAVQARDIGFLKGDEAEKNEAYERPYKALCDELMIFKSNNYKNLKEAGMIAFENTSFLRGQTFSNCIVLFDEIQNANYHELSTVISRMGENCRLLLSGDYKQRDLHRKGDESGLPKLIQVLSYMSDDHVSIIEYTPNDIVRSGIVKEFIMAEEQIF